MTARRRVAVFDAYWATAGGGEKYAAGVADVLSRAHDVTLLAHEPVDTDWLGERLALDLSRANVEIVDPCDPLDAVTAGYDLLVNLSYRSHHRNGATRGIYVVHFPDRPGHDRAGWQVGLQDRVGAVVRRRPDVEIEGGFHEPDVIRWQQVRWTNGDGRLRVDVPPGRTEVLHLRFGRFVPGGADREIEVLVDGRTAARATLSAPRRRLEVLEPLHVAVGVPGRTGGVSVEIRSDATVAHEVLGNGDHRRLGVPLVHASVAWHPLDPLRARASLLDSEPIGLGWLDSYDLVIANSPFTQHWIEEWWGRDSTVLEPPVGLREPAEKQPMVLSVGRFFAPGRGHAKKQLEMVRAFGRLCETGLEGWELHLVGGCSPDDRPYLDEVRRAAEGLPVVFHVEASGAELDALYRTATIYWHATGLGEDVEGDPVRAEHFGITTVEAMSAGAVPIVMAAGGQPDIVTDGVDGIIFRTEGELIAATAALVAEPVRLAAMSSAASATAERYGLEAFGRRLTAIVDAL